MNRTFVVYVHEFRNEQPLHLIERFEVSTERYMPMYSLRTKYPGRKVFDTHITDCGVHVYLDAKTPAQIAAETLAEPVSQNLVDLGIASPEPSVSSGL